MSRIQPDDLVAIGRIGKAVGLLGDYRYRIDTPYEDFFEEYMSTVDHLFVQLGGCFVPLPIEASNPVERLLRFGALHSDEINVISGASIGLSASKLPTDHDETLIGYTITHDDVEIGRVHDIMDNATQLIAQVISEDGTTHMIPLVADWMLDINHEQRMLYMTLPEGLLDL